ncbi:undecaprenyl-diphosphate phosphatase [Cronobacter sakazakii]|uniref:undecaprenyl-diphosphate phosphatase n=1 Tax=Cronobacter sakazakii TaxID=28141 RepID=UPI001376347C|nr:undecaprenyl-diphosphate phosphatase [Cronobacter sakazakii]NCH34569.1 undecaprenyl-diphosphate phosphatase [Cronobacter sakazakii]
MMEALNQFLFLQINATPASPGWLIALATFIARDLISIVPLLPVVLWLWRPTERRLVVKFVLALLISLAVSWLAGHLFPHPRPFVVGLGHQFLPHAPDDSYPSDHGTVIFTFALAFLFWHRVWSGALLMAVACAIAWSRVYLGVHWPLDMAGGLLVAMLACLSAQILWAPLGEPLYRTLRQLYRLCFALPIRKGWVRD